MEDSENSIFEALVSLLSNVDMIEKTVRTYFQMSLKIKFGKKRFFIKCDESPHDFENREVFLRFYVDEIVKLKFPFKPKTIQYIYEETRIRVRTNKIENQEDYIKLNEEKIRIFLTEISQRIDIAILLTRLNQRLIERLI